MVPKSRFRALTAAAALPVTRLDIRATHAAFTLAALATAAPPGGDFTADVAAEDLSIVHVAHGILGIALVLEGNKGKPWRKNRKG